MITTEVTELISALRNGSLSLEEVAQRFRERTWPRTRKPNPASYAEMAAAVQDDPEPYVPGPVRRNCSPAAYRRGELTDRSTGLLPRQLLIRYAPRISNSRNRKAPREALRCVTRLAVEPGSAHGQCQLAAGVALSFWSAAGWPSCPETSRGRRLLHRGRGLVRGNGWLGRSRRCTGRTVRRGSFVALGRSGGLGGYARRGRDRGPGSAPPIAGPRVAGRWRAGPS